MGLKSCFLSVVMAIVLRVVGNDVDNPTPVSVKVGDRAILPCNVSAYLDSGILGDSISILWKTNEEHVCAFVNGKSEAYNGYSNRTEICKEKIREGQVLLIIKYAVINDGADYFCYVQKNDGRMEYTSTVHLHVKETRVSAVIGGTLNISLYTKKDVRLTFGLVQPSAESRTVCEVNQGTVTQGCVYWLQDSPLDAMIQLPRLNLTHEGTYTVTDLSTGKILNIVVLAVEGHSKNCSLDHGGNLSLPLYSDRAIIEFAGERPDSMITVCRVEGDRVVDPDPRYHSRLELMTNRTLILRNLTTPDQGMYTVRDNSTGRAIATVAVTVSYPPLPTGKQTVDLRVIISVTVGPALLIGSAVLYYFCKKRCAKQRMKREVREEENEVPFVMKKSPLDITKKESLSTVSTII